MKRIAESWYARNSEIEKARTRAYRASLPADEAKERKRRYRKAQRARYLAQGLTVNGTPRKVPVRPKVEKRSAMDRLAETNARQAWQWWMRVAPDDWVARYYESLGKPWSNPRLTKTEQWRLRYQHDREFYHRQYARLQAKKLADRARMKGGATDSEIKHFRETHEACHWCGEFLPLRARTIDHVLPLSKGGAHELENLVVACRSCNSMRGNKRGTNPPLRYSREGAARVIRTAK